MIQFHMILYNIFYFILLYFAQYRKKHSISLQVPPWNFVAITRTYDSQRLYVRVKSTNSNVKQSARPIANLLSTTYSQLKAQTTEIVHFYF